MHPLADTGRVIAGRYRLDAPIGRGAMGVVWRARDQLLDRDVAVKEVQIAETLTAEERANAYQRTLREAKTAARLNHPGVVAVYDVAEDEGRPWIVMQLVSAQSLDQVLATSGPLSPRRTAEVGRQLLSALSVAHAAGVLHRDVKPSNVLLGRDDRAVLTDFGIATFQGDPRLTQTGMVMGSPGFTAPERIRGEDATPASDLWSLGATLYAAVEGYGPYENRGGAITTMSAIINEDAPAAPTAGPLAPVIAALLRREPADRPDTATAIRMISDVLPLLMTRSGPPPVGYEPTALSAASPPGTPEPWTPSAGEVPVDLAAFAAAEHTPPRPPSTGADTRGGEPPQSPTAPTTPQPILAEAPQYEQTPHDPSARYQPTRYDQPSRHEQPPGGWHDSPARPADPPTPDFSSWYDPSPRSGSSEPWAGAAYQPGPAPRPAGGPAPRSGPPPSPPPGSGTPSRSGPPPGSGSAAPPGARPDHQPGARGKRRSGLRWKIALVVLALLGAAAGAVTVVMLRHGGTGTPSGTSSTSSSATLAPASTAPQIVDAINDQVTGAIPVGWRTYSQQPAGAENAGFRLAAPVSWHVKVNGYQTYLTDPSANANILIDLTPHTFPSDMLREAEYIKEQSLAENRFPGYAQLGLSATNIRGQSGSFWKFTWLDNNVEQEAIDLLFVLPTSSGSQSYALYMTAPESLWNHMRPVFDEEVETFIQLS
jgi:eukaryotic-like serine/threonine-protein kinase